MMSDRSVIILSPPITLIISFSENSDFDESKSEVDSLSLASRDRGLSLDDMATHEDGYMTDSTMFTIHDDEENVAVSLKGSTWQNCICLKM